MNKRQFVQQRRDSWRKFEQMVVSLERNQSRKLLGFQINEFSQLLRQLSNDLAIVKSRDWGTHLSSYLNNLVSRGYNGFYREPAGNFSRFLQFVAHGFPQLFRANIAYFLAACLLFFGPFVIAWAAIQQNPELVTRILDEGMLVELDIVWSEDFQEMSRGEGLGSEGRTMMAGFYVQHNVGIALKCFATGILTSIGTVYTLLYNGIALGAVFGYMMTGENSGRFLSFVISHGSFELTAIAVAGGGGLMLGNAILHPGQRTRLESLRVRMKDAVQIAAGAAVMLLVAALIEAFWSPSNVPVEWKFGVGTVLWVLVFLYLGFAGRGVVDGVEAYSAEESPA